MREIKFRGKDMESYKWVYGNLCNACGNEHGAMCIDCFVVDPATVGQYTGLKDKNGVEIYEGDVLRAESGKIYEVIFGQGAYRIKHSTRKLLLVDGWYYEVIGNIHDAPELLGGTPSC